MNRKEELKELIIMQGVLPLYFYPDIEVSINVLKSLYEAGIRVVEYTNRGEAALKNFNDLQKVCNKEMTDMHLGAGTIKREADAENFVRAGADFIVCPGLVENVIKRADAENILCIPGCMTPTEIIRAETLGVKMIKLFPGSQIGPSFVKAIIPIFPDILFIPTGGVNVTEYNLSMWFNAGACAVGIGSKLITKDSLKDKTYNKITELTRQAVQVIRNIKYNGK